MGIVDELAEALRAVAERHHVPGATAGVLVEGESYTAAYGVTNVEHAAPVIPASLFQVGSISKTFTSAAVMLLVQEGRLTLEDPVARHLPDLGAATGLDFDAITVEHVLSHQSGFDGDHLFVRREWDDLGVLRDARRLFPPGAGYSYSNAGFSIAGALVTAISAQSFESFVRERLLHPLGMTSASFTADEAITHSVASPHWVNDGNALVIRGLGWQPGWELGPVDRPAAGLVASVEELLTWCRFQWTGTALDGSVILTRESLARLHAPVVNATAIEDIALDWSVAKVEGATMIGHGGLTAGFASDLSIVPARELAVVSLTNGTNGGLLNDELRRWALERFADLHETDQQPDSTVAIDTAHVAGRYVHSFCVLTVTPGPDPGTVVVTPSRREDIAPGGWQPPVDPPTTCAFFTNDQAVSTKPKASARVARFGFDGGSHQAGWLLWGGRRAPRID